MEDSPRPHLTDDHTADTVEKTFLPVRIVLSRPAV